MHFHEKEQQVFRDLLLGTFLKIENVYSGSGFIFLSAIVELMKLHDAYFAIEKEKTENMTFNDCYIYSDAIFSQRFELLPQKVNWTEH